MEKNRCAVLFDLDGVIIDSESVYSRFWSEIDRIYPTGIENFALYIKGTTLPEILTHFDSAEVRGDIVSRIWQFQRSMQFVMFDGVDRFLSELQGRGIPMAVVTSSDDEKMASLFSQLPMLRRFFTTVIDASKVTRSKPDPQGYLLGAEALGMEPERCFVFEDSIQGLKAGRAAGATVIGLSTTYPAEAVAPYADHVIGTLADMDVDRMLAVGKVSKL